MRQATGWPVGVVFPAGQEIFSLFSSIQTGSGAPTQFPIKWVQRVLSSGDKTAGSWGWPLTSKCWDQEWCSYTCIAPYILMTWWLIKYVDIFTVNLREPKSPCRKSRWSQLKKLTGLCWGLQGSSQHTGDPSPDIWWCEYSHDRQR
jgi:hypothetical protein